jgi:hypothetical protein
MCRLAGAVTALPIAAAGWLSVAPPAAADCVSSSGTTTCSQGEARGSNTGRGPGEVVNTGWPWNCGGWNWDCNNGWGLTIVLDPGRHNRPGRG